MQGSQDASASLSKDYTHAPLTYLAGYAAEDETVRDLQSSMARCAELGDACGGVTCEAGGEEACTVREGAEPLHSESSEVSYTKGLPGVATTPEFFALVDENSLGSGTCWRGHAAFEDCCDVVRWGPTGRAGCWEQGGSFEDCCVGPLLGGCKEGCGEGGKALVAGVSDRMCAEGWTVHACDIGGSAPELAFYSQWSPSYLMTLAWMLRSLRLARASVRVILRRVWDTRNVTSGDQFSWGPSGYQRQRAVRAQWFRSVVLANWLRAAVISDTDVEYFPGWLSSVQSCLASGADLCLGQQPGWQAGRRDNLNPGFMALRGGERTLRLFEGMPEYGDHDGLPRSELYTFNHYLNTHPAAEGGPRWAVFHPEVLLTGLRGMEIRALRLRIHHAATGSVPHQTKALAVQRVRASQFRLRKFCARMGAGRYPAHPVCLPGGDFPPSRKSKRQEFRVGGSFVQEDLQRVMMEYNGAMAYRRGDSVFTRLLNAARLATGSGFPTRLCNEGGACEEEQERELGASSL